MLLIVAVAFAAISCCGKCGEKKCCDKCCQDSAACCQAADSAAVEVVEAEAEAPAAE